LGVYSLWGRRAKMTDDDELSKSLLKLIAKLMGELEECERLARSGTELRHYTANVFENIKDAHDCLQLIIKANGIESTRTVWG